MAAGVIAGVVLFDIAPESIRSIGTVATIALLLAGASVAVGLKFNARQTKTKLISPFNLAFWFHSLLEGAAVATSLRLDPRLGSIVLAGVLLHLLPEILAVIVLLQRLGSSFKQAFAVGCVTIGILVVSFVTFKFIPVTEVPVQILATLTGGILLSISSRLLYQQLKSRSEAYGQV